jgi:hypothetical protein
MRSPSEAGIEPARIWQLSVAGLSYQEKEDVWLRHFSSERGPPRTIYDVDDGLEAACKAFPDLNLEAIDASDDTTLVVDIDNDDVMYIVKQIKPTA